jgi:hypothetical protein
VVEEKGAAGQELVVPGRERGEEVGEVLVAGGALGLGGEPDGCARVDQALLQEYGEDSGYWGIVVELNGAGDDAVVAGGGCGGW